MVVVKDKMMCTHSLKRLALASLPDLLNLVSFQVTNVEKIYALLPKAEVWP